MHLQQSLIVAIAATAFFLNAFTALASDWKSTNGTVRSAVPPASEKSQESSALSPDDADFVQPFLVPVDTGFPSEGPLSLASEEEVYEASTPDFDEEIPTFIPSRVEDDQHSFDDSLTPLPGEAEDSVVSTHISTSPEVKRDSEVALPEVVEDKGQPGLWNESSVDWILGSGSDGIGFVSLTADAPSWEFDLSTDDQGLEVDFGSAVHFVSGPGRTDLPPRLFDIFWNARFKTEITEGFGIDASFKLGLFTDFEDSVRDGWRFPGRALGYMDVHRDLEQATARLVAGIEYLDLEQTEILPAGGLIIEPTQDVRLDLYFPRPQARFRINQAEDEERWLYLRGEYHSSAWAIERTTGKADVVALTEYRATIGLETIPHDKDESSSFIEVGYIFGRDLEYRSQLGNFQPEDTFVFRVGSRY